MIPTVSISSYNLRVVVQNNNSKGMKKKRNIDSYNAILLTMTKIDPSIPDV